MDQKILSSQTVSGRFPPSWAILSCASAFDPPTQSVTFTYVLLCVGGSKVKAGIQLKYIPERGIQLKCIWEGFSFELFDLSFNLKIEVVVEGSIYL